MDHPSTLTSGSNLVDVLEDMGKLTEAEPLLRWVVKSRNEIENASRMALIYPNAFLKMTVTERESVYERVLPVGVPPWQVIVDRDSARWDTQRFVGHVYWIPWSVHWHEPRVGPNSLHRFFF